MLGSDEKLRVENLVNGAKPNNGFEKHLLGVVKGRGSACTPKEKAWHNYWLSYQEKTHITDLGVNASIVAPASLSALSPELDSQNDSGALKDDNTNNLRLKSVADLKETRIEQVTDSTRGSIREVMGTASGSNYDDNPDDFDGGDFE
jgi:hypothetical protein